MELLHFSAINEAYHKGILRSWEEGGCLAEITNRLGYRLTLISADFNEQVKPGGVLNLIVNLTNTGFASIINERQLYVVLSPLPPGEQSQRELQINLDIDPRAWEPGNAQLKIKLHIPSDAKEFEYRLALRLPDENISLLPNPLYSIRFANENVFDESTGYNILGTVKVDNSAGGSYQRGELFDVIESTSSVERSVVSLEPIPTPALQSPAGETLISNIEISNDAENVYLSLDYASGTYNAFQIFVDEDQNPQTGYVINGIGADALFENHTWNIYNGSGNDWNWAPTELLIHFEDTGNHVSWNISRSLLRSSGLDIVFQLVDSNWDAVFVTDKITYTLK
jgi:hypothetical protein